MADGIHYVQVILTDSQHMSLSRLARRDDSTVSRYIRKLVLAAIEREQEQRKR